MSHHILRLENVAYTYPDGCRALEDISFTVGHGQHMAVVGANGAGKSTLLLCMGGLLLPTSGTIAIGSTKIVRRTLSVIRRSVGLVFQNPDDQLFMPTVEEDVAFGPVNMGLPPDQIELRVEDALRRVGAEDLRRKAPYRLSGGQKKRVAIASVLAMEPSVLVMDEPTAGLDPKARRQIMELVAEFEHTTVIATHDMQLAEELCPRTIMMLRGRLSADGPTEALLHDRGLLELSELA